MLVGRVAVELRPVREIIRKKGLMPGGAVQRQHTANVLRRIVRYLPYRSGETIKQTIIQTDINRPEIVTRSSYAKYIYYGKVMVDPKTGAAGFMTKKGWRSRKGVPKVRTDRPLEYTKDMNPLAGPRWDRRLVSAEGKLLARELQDYLDRRKHP